MNRKHRAMTLVEVMMALMITSMIGAVTTSVTVALFNAQRTTDAYTENVQTGRMSLAQLQSLIESSHLVTEGDATTMTLWAFDADGRGVINTDELVRLRFDSTQDAIMQVYVSYPSSLSDETRQALNLPLALAEATDWNVASNMMSESRIHDTVIATGISAVTFRYDAVAPLTKLVSIEATFGEGTQAKQFHTAAALRAPATAWVEIDHGIPLLVPPNGVASLVGSNGMDSGS